MLNSIAFKVRKFTYKNGEKMIHPLKVLTQELRAENISWPSVSVLSI